MLIEMNDENRDADYLSRLRAALHDTERVVDASTETCNRIKKLIRDEEMENDAGFSDI